MSDKISPIIRVQCVFKFWILAVTNFSRNCNGQNYLQNKAKLRNIANKLLLINAMSKIINKFATMSVIFAGTKLVEL